VATLTTHVLDSLRGRHAAGLGVTAHRIEASGARSELFSAATDDGGRLRKTVQMKAADAGTLVEMTFHAADYFARQPGCADAAGGVTDATVRFRLPDPDGACHIPVMLSPHGYSLWCSGGD